eukprot:CAMPEP_0197564000 /NCGR_PEP_ID=MMETSP1320-20131121/29706_1 /TAXON_ID=91990 /ORGANISM="Bolidomonas sp., Strain RCC2347" /LENGTH=154 /DNA_ID=CAMNT_0043125881 /DNA_START=271 /DNA_END=732 /DNA_ORIENTATION=+
MLSPKNSRNRAVILAGAPYSLAEHNGRGHGIRLGSITAAAIFTIDGNLDDRSAGVSIRLKADPDLAFEVNFRKFEAGSNMSLWSVNNHREYAVRFCFNSDGTISPQVNQALCIGVSKSDKNTLALVKKHDSRRIEFRQDNASVRSAAATSRAEE